MATNVRILRQAVCILWASPWSCVGLCLGTAGLLSGGRVRRGPGILEFHGGAVTRFLALFPTEPFAMTLGHTVLGLSEAALDMAQPHELVHVRQYERWGPLFIPAYFACWIVLQLQGKDGYWDNPFEREAYNRPQ